jgi:hypothetical protein
MKLLRALGWTATTALVVLLGRTIVYALSPSPLALHFEHAAGGPRLPAVTIAAAALGLGAACLVLWLAALGVRERRLLAPQPAADPRPIRPFRVLARAATLNVAASAVFTVVESTIHWREGLGWHGIHCLVGPVHRNALPVLAALALVAAACAEALEHVLAWMRRTIERLRSAGIRLAPAPVPLLAAPVSSPAAVALPAGLRARGPPLA